MSARFPVLQADILGKCDSVYSVVGSAPTYKVTKVRYLDTCVEKPMWEAGIFAGTGHSCKDKVATSLCCLIFRPIKVVTF